MITNESILRAAEKKIVRSLANEMLAFGYKVSVWDGEAEIPCATAEGVEKEVFGVDESDIKFRREDGKRGWVRIVLGNGPEDLISDYSDNVETANIVNSVESKFLP